MTWPLPFSSEAPQRKSIEVMPTAAASRTPLLLRRQPVYGDHGLMAVVIQVHIARVMHTHPEADKQ